MQATSTSAAIGARDGPVLQVHGHEVADRVRGGPAPRLAAAAGAPPATAAAPDAGPASRAALAVIAECLERGGWSLRDLAGLCVADGPGAFTALRVAVAVIQGLGLGSGLPVLPVPSLAALATAAVAADALHEPGAAGAAAFDRRLVFTAIDARMRECYFAAWEVRVQPDPARSRQWPLAARPLPLATDPSHLAGCVGSGPSAVRAFDEMLVAHGARFLRRILVGSAFDTESALHDWRPPSAGAGPATRRITVEADAAAVLATALADGPAAAPYGPLVAAADLRPRYLRDKVALDVDEQRALSARRDASSSGA